MKMLEDLSYFEGSYFKLENQKESIAFIPAYHWKKGEVKKASLQIITSEKSYVKHFPFTEITYQRKPLSVRLGHNYFSLEGIDLNIIENDFSLKGEVKFSQLVVPRVDIMGPFSMVPFMECRHSLFSMKHKISGNVELNEKKYDLSQGIGYMEGDRGRSFPREYMWTHCFFSNERANSGSLMLAVAEIPVPFAHFTGIIGFVLWKGKEYRFATYFGAKVTEMTRNSVEIVQGSYKLRVELLKKQDQVLQAPDFGEMNREIRESIRCKGRYQFFQNDRLLLDVESKSASFEFEYSL